jgi:hypothetical protein
MPLRVIRLLSDVDQELASPAKPLFLTGLAVLFATFAVETATSHSLWQVGDGASPRLYAPLI